MKSFFPRFPKKNDFENFRKHNGRTVIYDSMCRHLVFPMVKIAATCFVPIKPYTKKYSTAFVFEVGIRDISDQLALVSVLVFLEKEF